MDVSINPYFLLYLPDFLVFLMQATMKTVIICRVHMHPLRIGLSFSNIMKCLVFNWLSACNGNFKICQKQITFLKAFNHLVQITGEQLEQFQAWDLPRVHPMHYSVSLMSVWLDLKLPLPKYPMWNLAEHSVPLMQSTY